MGDLKSIYALGCIDNKDDLKKIALDRGYDP